MSRTCQTFAKYAAHYTWTVLASVIEALRVSHGTPGHISFKVCGPTYSGMSIAPFTTTVNTWIDSSIECVLTGPWNTNLLPSLTKLAATRTFVWLEFFPAATTSPQLDIQSLATNTMKTIMWVNGKSWISRGPGRDLRNLTNCQP